MHAALITEVSKTCTHPMPESESESGPVVDSAATVPAVCKKDIKHLTNIRVLEEPLRVDVGSGPLSITSVGQWVV